MAIVIPDALDLGISTALCSVDGIIGEVAYLMLGQEAMGIGFSIVVQ